MGTPCPNTSVRLGLTLSLLTSASQTTTDWPVLAVLPCPLVGYRPSSSQSTKLAWCLIIGKRLVLSRPSEYGSAYLSGSSRSNRLSFVSGLQRPTWPTRLAIWYVSVAYRQRPSPLLPYRDIAWAATMYCRRSFPGRDLGGYFRPQAAFSLERQRQAPRLIKNCQFPARLLVLG